MWIFAASRIAMLKQRMKGQDCRELIMRASGEECIYLHVAHPPDFICLAGNVLKMDTSEGGMSDSRRVQWQRGDRRD